jgi:hypothetical protein
MAEIDEIKAEIKALSTKMDKNTAITQKGFERINVRVNKLELRQAFNDGADSVSKPGNGDDWRKATFKLIGVLVSIVALASTAAALVAKAVIQ